MISCRSRESLYVLSGLLLNDTILQPERHHVDTGGYTEHLFALCHLLGIEFMPRIKDLADQQPYKLDRDRHYGTLDELFRGTVDSDLISEQWDQMVRVAAALKNRYTPPEVVVQRLASAGSADRLAKALTAFRSGIKYEIGGQSMQNGSIMRTERRRGPDVWEYRWREPGADGKRKHRRIFVGTIKQFADKSAVFRGTSALRRDINLANVRCKGKPATLVELADHYCQRELASGNRWKTPSTKLTYRGYAITGHRSQGKTVDAVILSGDVMKQELFYVAASRGRERNCDLHE